jgi:hypothetical protein
MMEGRFSGEGIHSMDADDDLLAAMAREHVEQGGIGESADVVWAELKRERTAYAGATPQQLPPRTWRTPPSPRTCSESRPCRKEQRRLDLYWWNRNPNPEKSNPSGRPDTSSDNSCGSSAERARAISRLRPATSCAGIAITIAALIAMPVLAFLKRREARRSENATLAADAVQSATCAYLALIALVGLVINAGFHVAWFDSVALWWLFPSS